MIEKMKFLSITGPTLGCADLRHVHGDKDVFILCDGRQRKMPILSRMISKTTAAFSVLLTVKRTNI